MSDSGMVRKPLPWTLGFSRTRAIILRSVIVRVACSLLMTPFFTAFNASISPDFLYATWNTLPYPPRPITARSSKSFSDSCFALSFEDCPDDPGEQTN